MEKERPNLYKIKSDNESLIRALHPTPLVSVARFFLNKKNPVHILDTTQIQERKENAEAENKQTVHNKYTTNN